MKLLQYQVTHQAGYNKSRTKSGGDAKKYLRGTLSPLSLPKSLDPGTTILDGNKIFLDINVNVPEYITVGWSSLKKLSLKKEDNFRLDFCKMDIIIHICL